MTLLRIETGNQDGATWLTLRGEADIASLEDLQDALASIKLNGCTCVHLNVAGLDFADVATLRQLALFARQARQEARAVTTCGATAVIRKVACLLSVDEELGLT